MNDPLFKQLREELSPEAESEFTRRLVAAYREHEASERRPEVERITNLIREQLDKEDEAS
jgi:phage terminase large subunit-like protein